MSFHEATRHSDFVRKFVLIVWQNVANEAEMMPWKLSDKLHVFLSQIQTSASAPLGPVDLPGLLTSDAPCPSLSHSLSSCF